MFAADLRRLSILPLKLIWEMGAKEAIAQEVAEIKTFLDAKAAAAVLPVREETERLKAQVQEVLKWQRELRRNEILSSLGTSRKIAYGKYAGLDRLDLAMHQAILQGIKNQPGREDLQPARAKMLEDWGARLKAAMDSTTAASGDELVPTQEAAALWDDVNLDTLALPLFARVNMPSNPFDIPLQLGDVNWYPGTQNVALTSTALATAKQTLTAYELGCMVPWSYDLDEDAVLAMADEIRRHLTRNASEVIDDVLLNADTTATNGINSDGATISTSSAGKAHWLIGFDGLVHLPLVDNTGQRVDHNAAVNDDLFNKQRSKMARFGVRPSELAFIMDLNTFIRAQSVANYRTIRQAGVHGHPALRPVGGHRRHPHYRQRADAPGRHRRQGDRRGECHRHRAYPAGQPHPVAGGLPPRDHHRGGPGRAEASKRNGSVLPAGFHGAVRDSLHRQAHQPDLRHHRGHLNPSGEGLGSGRRKGDAG